MAEIIHVDIAAFAVAVERVVHPELRRRPVVVAPVGPSRSVVTAISTEAWEAGIRKGMILARALRRCRDLVVLPPNEPLYARASRALCRVLEGFSPVLEPAGYGHAYLDMTGTGRLFGPPRDAAWRAQREIRQRLRLDAALGVAADKMVSRIAAVVTKPVGLQDVAPGDESAFLAPLPAQLLPGVGPKTQEQLRELNIRIIREVAAMQPEHLVLAFGRFGFVLHQRALGIDDTPVYPPRAVPAVEEEAILAEDSNDWDLLKGTLCRLCARAGGKAARAEAACRADGGARPVLGLSRSRGQAKLAPPLQSTAGLTARAGRLLEQAMVRRTRVRSLHLSLTGLSSGPAAARTCSPIRPSSAARASNPPWTNCAAAAPRSNRKDRKDLKEFKSGFRSYGG